MYRVKNQIHWEEAVNQEITGKNVTVAVLDTGIAEHPDFDKRILAFQDFVKGKKEKYDDSGHGTHVCGIIAGNGLLSRGNYCGVAPEANLVVGKILDQNGDGTVHDMINGVEWVIQNREKYNIKILNVSIGAGQQNSQEIELNLIKCIEKVWKSGIVVVTAAGNQGPKPMTISPVGSSKLVITVGCHEGGYFGDRENLCENYSGRGPTRYSEKKPDVVAPGTDIISCNGDCYKQYYKYYNGYIKKSGTSMATPIVSGCCALAMQKFPCYDNEQIKRKVIYTATDLKESWTKQGWGMVNIKRILED